MASRVSARMKPKPSNYGVVAVLALAISCAKPIPPRTTPADPDVIPIIPAPRLVDVGAGEPFGITPATTVVIASGNDDVLRIAQQLRDFIGTSIGPDLLRIDQSGGGASENVIALALDGAIDGSESYDLTITSQRVLLVAKEPAGLFYGMQTLRQLLPPWMEYRAARPAKSRVAALRPLRIVDQPRFAWRGAMLDVARHFFSVDDVKRYIDLLALYKFNRLHLHLADDQGWRIEITTWPNLTRHGGSTEVGGGAGGHYTQKDYAELVSYARDRFITIIPEIDMPGHTNAALASYAELNCDDKTPALYTGIQVGFSALCVEREVVYKFVDDVVREIAQLTSGAYFHIGGDEVKTLTPEQYARFIERVQTIVQSHGKQMIGWDEVAAVALSPTSIVQHWRPGKFPAQAAANGIKIILSPADKIYLDMKYDAATALGLNWAGYVNVQTAYDWDPVTMTGDASDAAILGIEAPLWSETLDHIRDVEYLAFPRLLAVAEIAWTKAERRQWPEFRARLGQHGSRLSALGVNFYRSPEVSWGR